MTTKHQADPKPIRNTRRLLILSPSSHSLSLIPTLLHKLTNQPPVDPPAPTQTFAGYTTHPPLRITNKYYTAEIPIWVDEIPLGRHATPPAANPPSPAVPASDPEAPGNTTASQWETEFSSPEAQVVRDAIGAVVICIKNPEEEARPHPGSEPAPSVRPVEDRDDVRDLKDFIRAIGHVRALIEEERGEVADVPGLVVLGSKGGDTSILTSTSRGGIGTGEEEGLDVGLDDPFSVAWWEDQLCEMGLMGFEVVRWDLSGEGGDEERRNQYGEYQGIRRIKEVLETHDWASGDGDLDTSIPDDDDLEKELLGWDDDEEGSGFGLEVNELEREMVGLRLAIERGGGDGDEDDEGDQEIRVEAVEALLLRMKAIKDMSDELPEKERKQFAAKAVKDIMKEI